MPVYAAEIGVEIAEHQRIEAECHVRNKAAEMLVV